MNILNKGKKREIKYRIHRAFKSDILHHFQILSSIHKEKTKLQKSNPLASSSYFKEFNFLFLLCAEIFVIIFYFLLCTHRILPYIITLTHRYTPQAQKSCIVSALDIVGATGTLPQYTSLQ